MREGGGELVKLTGLWENLDRNGNTYLSGRLGMGKILIFRNTKKNSDRSPDWFIFVASTPNPSKGMEKDYKQNPYSPTGSWEDLDRDIDDDIPF